MKRTEHNIVITSDCKGNTHIFADGNRIPEDMRILNCISFIGEPKLFTDILKTTLKYYMK